MKDRPKIDWSAPFPEVMRQWAKAHEFTNAKAAATLKINLETWHSWLYAKGGRECPYPETIKLLMQKMP